MAETIQFPRFSSVGGVLARNWWLMLVRGVIAILFALATFAWPAAGLLTFVWLYGAYAVVDGATSLAAAIRGGVKDRWWLAIAGVISIAAGLVAFALPALAGLTLVVLIGVWSIFRGFAEIAAGISLRKEIRHEWLLMLGGAISILFGLAIIAAPAAGALAMLWLVASWALVFGVLMVVWAFRLRRLPR